MYSKFELVVNKQELLRKLEENRSKHAKDYEKAIALWRKECEKEVSNINWATATAMPKSVCRLINDCPKSFMAEYDKAINMLEMDVRDEVQLDTQGFNMFCCDDWDWKGQFLSNRYYLESVGYGE